MKRISDTGIEITNRFFEAIDELKRQKVIRGLKTFTTRFNANRKKALIYNFSRILYISAYNFLRKLYF